RPPSPTRGEGEHVAASRQELGRQPKSPLAPREGRGDGGEGCAEGQPAPRLEEETQRTPRPTAARPPPPIRREGGDVSAGTRELRPFCSSGRRSPVASRSDRRWI